MRNYYYNYFLLLAFFLGCVLPLSAQTSVRIGSSADVAAKFKAKADGNKIKPIQNASRISQFVPGQDTLLLNLKVSRKEGTADVYIGDVANKKNGTFFLKVSGEKLSGYIILKDQKKAYKYSSNASGQAFLQEVDINKVVCIEYVDGPVKSSATTGGTSATATAVPDLQSLPGAPAVVLLDFNGQYVNGSYWNNGNPIDAAPANLTSADMQEAWRMISEDFLPFAVNITTNEAVYLKAPATSRMRVIFTPTDFFYPGAGGVAYVNSFTWGNETPCWVFNSGAKYAGEAGSHEIGHTLGLAHDGRTSPSEAYYYGHGTWAPIMGAGYYNSLVQWSKGEYLNADNLEDDLSIITTQNGFSYRADDHANTSASATPLKADAAGKVTASSNNGIIGSVNDVDVFSFQTGGGTVALTVNPSAVHANLDILLTLKNSSNKTIVVSDPAELSASINQNLAAGTYFVYVQGARGASGANSSYGSIGQYFVSGSLPATSTANPMLVTAGGTQFSDGQSRVWSADAHFSGGVTAFKSFDVAGTTDDELYLKYRYASSGAPFSYNIPVSEAGTYRVKLHFLEPYFGAPGGKTSGLTGARVFHVDLEGKRVLTNYDIYSQDGAGKAVVKTFESVTVNDGALSVAFTSLADNAIISGIEIEKVVAAYTLTVNTTGSGTVTKSPNQSNYTSGTSVSLTAKAATGYEFSGWSGDASGTTNPLTVTMNSNKVFTANFKQTPTTSASPLLVASGGTQYTDQQSRNWKADAHFSGGVTAFKSFDVAGTTDDELYLKYRYASSGAPFSYNIPVSEAGTYRVKLHFLEPYFGAPGGKTSGLTGARVFHVDLEGKRVLTNYDIYSQDGAGKAVVKTFESVTVNDGALSIAFTSVTNNAIISGIEIERVSASDPVAAVTTTATSAALEMLDEKNVSAYPNPFSDRIKVSFTSLKNQSMEVKVYDSKGREVANLYKGKAEADRLYEFEWIPGAGQASGMYFLQLQTPENMSNKKILLNR